MQRCQMHSLPRMHSSVNTLLILSESHYLSNELFQLMKNYYFYFLCSDTFYSSRFAISLPSKHVVFGLFSWDKSPAISTETLSPLFNCNVAFNHIWAWCSVSLLAWFARDEDVLWIPFTLRWRYPKLYELCLAVDTNVNMPLIGAVKLEPSKWLPWL